MELVTAIIPTYNRQSYIKEAVESVLNQDYNPIEIIVVDDGSTDGTADVIQPFIGKIRYVRQENGGPAKARNAGINTARGEYITFLDSDDRYYPNKMGRQVEYIRSHPECGMVYCDWEYFDDSGKRWHVPGKKYKGWVFERLLFEDFIGSGSTIMAKKEVLQKAGLYNEALITGEDRNLYLKIAKSHKIGFVDQVLVGIREHLKRLSFNYEVQLGTIDGIKDIIRLYPEYKPERSSLMRRALAARTLQVADELFCAGKYLQARRSYWESVRYNPRHLLIFKFLFYSLVPSSVIDFLKLKLKGKQK